VGTNFSEQNRSFEKGHGLGTWTTLGKEKVELGTRLYCLNDLWSSAGGDDPRPPCTGFITIDETILINVVVDS
jgi:hypothetical protein